MKFINWRVRFINPITKDILEEKIFPSIEEIHNNYSFIKLTTWRNMSIGRSRVYSPFLRVDKIILNTNHLPQ